MALVTTTFRIYKTVELLSDLVSSLGDCFVKCLEDGNVYVNEGGVFKKVITATGTPDGTKFLRDDGVWSTVAGGGGTSVPAGVVSQYAGSPAPSGYLLCDGSAVSRTTYSNLFTAISTSYGAGDGSTTFNLPNLKGRIPVGLDAAQTEFDVLGEVGGAKTHTLTVTEMPSHTHTQNSHTHTQTVNSATTGGLSGYTPDTSTNTSVVSGYSTGATTATNQNTGGDGAHNNLQPYIIVNYIIKT